LGFELQTDRKMKNPKPEINQKAKNKFPPKKPTWKSIAAFQNA